MKQSRLFAALLATTLAFVPTVHAQQTALPEARDLRLVFAGDEQEQYLRVLQLVGALPAHQWTVRGFGPRELDHLTPIDSLNPWGRLADNVSRRSGALAWSIVPLSTFASYNTGFPYGFNDGAIWQGKGATVAAQGGAAARLGPLSVTLAPIAFAAQNATFPLRANGTTGRFVFGNAFYPAFIDDPQRFGNGAYARLDPGQSTVRVDVGPVAVGATTANEYWGPSLENPLILGTNAPGIPRLFVGTSAPLDLWLVKVHGRVFWGREYQSSYSAADSNETHRFANAAVGTMQIRGVPGLEIGAARFFHLGWPAGQNLPHNYFFRVFEGAFKQSLSATDSLTDAGINNQLASVFFRWAFPGHGFEAYGEFGREDFNANARDLEGQPDHDAAYTIGLQRVWRRRDQRLLVVSAEVVNSRVSHLTQALIQSPWYIHNSERQGHTELGQILGSPSVLGGGGALLAVTSYDRAGRTTVSLRRQMRAERLAGFTNLPSPDSADVMQSLAVERSTFVRDVEWRAGAAAIWDLNRNFDRRTVFNQNVYVAATLRW